MENEKSLRTQEEINQEYTQCALQYGDKLFKMKLIQNEVAAIEVKMHVLASEKAIIPAPVSAS